MHESLFRRAIGSIFFMLISFQAGAQTLIAENEAVIDASISVIDEVDSYSFELLAGESVQARMADLVGDDIVPNMALYNPAGTVVTWVGGYNVAALLNYTAPADGVYTLRLRSGDGANIGSRSTGDYRLYFARFPGANELGELIDADSKNGDIELGDIDVFTFQATAGESAHIRVADLDPQSPAEFFPYIHLYDPDGNLVGNTGGYIVAAMQNISLGKTGTYSIAVTGGHHNGLVDSAGPYELHFARSVGSNEHGEIISGETSSEAISQGDIDTYTFRAGVGDRVSLEMTDDDDGGFYPYMHLYGTRGELIAHSGGYDAAELNNIQLRDQGTYTVVLTGGHYNGAIETSGNYTLRFHSTSAMLQVTQAVFDSGDAPTPLIHQRTTALIVDRTSPWYSDAIVPAITQTVNGVGTQVFPIAGQSFRVQDTPGARYFYCDSGNVYCNLQAGASYGIAVSVGGSPGTELSMKQVEVVEAERIAISYVPVYYSFCGVTCLTSAEIDSFVADSNRFIQYTFPISDTGLTNTPAWQTDALGDSRVAVQNGWLLYVFYRIPIWSYLNIVTKARTFANTRNPDARVRRGIAVVTQDFFVQMGQPIGFGATPAWVPDAAVVAVEGGGHSTAHELGHTFGLFTQGQEEYDLYPQGVPANGFNVFSGLPVAGKNFMGLHTIGSTDADYWVNESSWDALLPSLAATGTANRALLDVSFVVSGDDAVMSMEWFEFSGVPNAIPVQPTEKHYVILLKDRNGNILSRRKVPAIYPADGASAIFGDADYAYLGAQITLPLHARSLVVVDADGKEVYSVDPVLKIFTDYARNSYQACRSPEASQRRIEALLDQISVSPNHGAAVERASSLRAYLLATHMANPLCNWNLTPFLSMQDFSGKLDNLVRRLQLRQRE